MYVIFTCHIKVFFDFFQFSMILKYKNKVILSSWSVSSQQGQTWTIECFLMTSGIKETKPNEIDERVKKERSSLWHTRLSHIFQCHRPMFECQFQLLSFWSKFLLMDLRRWKMITHVLGALSPCGSLEWSYQLLASACPNLSCWEHLDSEPMGGKHLSLSLSCSLLLCVCVFLLLCLPKIYA